jgi:hypothetical protein
MNADWPAMAEGPRCEPMRTGASFSATGQAASAAGAAAGRWCLARCSRARQRCSRRIRDRAPRGNSRHRCLLLARSTSDPQARSSDALASEQRLGAAETPLVEGPSGVTMPTAAPARLDAGEAPPAAGEHPSLAHSFPTQPPGEPPLPVQQPASQGPVLAELQLSLLELENAPPRGTRDLPVESGRGGSLLASRSRTGSLLPFGAPRARGRTRRSPAARRPLRGQLPRPRRSTCGARILPTSVPWNWPQPRNSAPARTSVWATSLCARGKFAQAWEHAQSAQKLIGDDPRTAFLRARCLLGMKQPREKRASSRKQSTGGHDNG